MDKNFNMSYFDAPIARYEERGGKVVSATLRPVATVCLQQVFQLITCNERLRSLTLQVRQDSQTGEAKKRLLPYVTPCGTFDYRRSDHLGAPSGLVVVDVDGLPSPSDAAGLRDSLFADPVLLPALCFVSPGGCGVKAFIPYVPSGSTDVREDIAAHTFWAMEYVQTLYQADRPADAKAGVDTSGKDVVRACFLCHDPEARMRLGVEPVKLETL